MFRLTFSTLLFAILIGCTNHPSTEKKAKGASTDSLREQGDWTAEDTAPELIKEVEPEYPKGTDPIEGKIWLMALVDTVGDVRDAKIYKSCGVACLDSPALQAAYKYKYKPGIKNGQPVACWVTYEVEFKLP